jgi:ataxin-3
MPPSLYHEKQVSLLCGQHALNSLLQGPYFTAEDLTAIAVEFDERERNLMRESGVESADFLKYMAEDSGNAAADGNYSIQVLTRALEQWNLKCLPVMSQEAGTAWQAPQRERAFICNLDRHWLTLRRCEIADPNVHAGGTGGWWNFNSTFPAPRPISDLYLAEFLRQLRDEGYGIFVCRGVLPEPRGPGRSPATAGARVATLRDSDAGAHGAWVTAAEASGLNRAQEASKRATLARDAAARAFARLGNGNAASFTVAADGAAEEDAEEAQMRAAIEASLMGPGPGGAFAAEEGAAASSDDDLARALAASLATAGPGTGGAQKRAAAEMSAISAGADEDADLAAAIAASVAETPFSRADNSAKKTASAPSSSRRDAETRSASGGTLGACADDQGDDQGDQGDVFEPFLEPEPAMNDADAIDVAVRGGGARARRRFRKADPVRSLEAWVGRVLGLDMRRHQLATSFPRKALTDPDATLEQAGVRDKDALAVEPKRG